ncbi:MAG: methylaspartate mutase subunit S [Chloroflexi bacterium]|nr:methylaspartate mutase subunit S [Chloroflexota bacterium]
MDSAKKGTIVIGTIGHDVHNIGAGILQYALGKEGYKVVPLGVAVTQEEFLSAAVETAADAIFVSSLSGMAEIECRGLREKCTEAGLGDILLYVGGNLVVGRRDWSGVEAQFKDMGYNRVAPPGAKVEMVLAWLDSDLGRPLAAGPTSTQEAK